MDIQSLVIAYPNLILSLFAFLLSSFILALIITSPIFIFITNTMVIWFSKIKYLRWLGIFYIRAELLVDVLGKLFAILLVLTIVFAAHDTVVYSISIFIVATFITYPDFLLRLAAIIFRNQKYFEVEIIRENIRNNSQNEMLQQELVRLKRENEELYFVNVYKDIYGSQLVIMTILNTDKEKYFGSALFQSIHRKTDYKDRYPFPEYMKFLLALGLVEYKEKDNTYKITLLGSRFLDYLSRNNLPLSKVVY